MKPRRGHAASMTEKGTPYRPKYKGFDEETTRNAQATADRAKEGAGAKGEDANKEYVDDGPEEYERRTGSKAPDVEGAAKKSR